MTRRTLFKIVALLPFVGPAVTKALQAQTCALGHVRRLYLPAIFPKWDPAVDGLENAGNWVLALERARLPKDLAFPREGEIWEAVRECEVDFHAQIDWQRPAGLGLQMASTPLSPAQFRAFMGFGTATLPWGERVRILPLDHPKPVDVSFVPIRYEHLQQQIVPEEVRKLPGYQGFALRLKTARTVADFNSSKDQSYFTEAFRLVGGVA